MSDVVTSGFPVMRETGNSTDRQHGGQIVVGQQRVAPPPAFGAWECLQLALAKPPSTTRSAKDAKWSFHAVDAVRVILGLDTLYANER